jgi:hypothetical protein
VNDVLTTADFQPTTTRRRRLISATALAVVILTTATVGPHAGAVVGGPACGRGRDRVGRAHPDQRRRRGTREATTHAARRRDGLPCFGPPLPAQHSPEPSHRSDKDHDVMTATPHRTTGARSAGLLAALLSIASAAVAGCAADSSSAIVGSWSGVCSDSPTMRSSGEAFTVRFQPNGDLATSTPGYGEGSLEHGRYTVSGTQITLTQSNQTLRGTYTITDSTLRLDGLTGRYSGPTWCVMTPGGALSPAGEGAE